MTEFTPLLLSLAENLEIHRDHIVENHPFIDGNKRVGAMSAYVFLRLNGLDLQASNESFEGLVRAVAEGKADKGRVAEFLRLQTGKPAAGR